MLRILVEEEEREDVIEELRIMCDKPPTIRCEVDLEQIHLQCLIQKYVDSVECTRLWTGLDEMAMLGSVGGDGNSGVDDLANGLRDGLPCRLATNACDELVEGDIDCRGGGFAILHHCEVSLDVVEVIE